RSLAPDMRTTPTFILERQKSAQATEFAAHIRNVTPTAIALTIPFGALEREPTMSEPAYHRLLASNRARVSAPSEAPPKPPSLDPQHPTALSPPTHLPA